MGEVTVEDCVLVHRDSAAAHSDIVAGEPYKRMHSLPHLTLRYIVSLQPVDPE